MERIRTKRLSSEQRDTMLAYLKQHPTMLKGRGKNPCNKYDSWTELAKILNRIRSGPRKPVYRWLKSFQDWKTLVKAKNHRLRLKNSLSELTDQERELLRLMQETDGGDPLEPSSCPNGHMDAEPQELKPSISEVDSDSRTLSSPEPEEPRARRKRKRQREGEDPSERENRAIQAMEQQASSLDRMASAMERIADAVTNALERFSSADNSR